MRYFLQISAVERKMLGNMDVLLEHIKEPPLAESLRGIREDEIRHLQLLEKIGEIVERLGGRPWRR
jgi:hypothetical protein